jgi:hypothetical protein
MQRVVWTDADGDDYAKTSYYGMPRTLDITDKLFFEVWKQAVDNIQEVKTEVTKQPFDAANFSDRFK